MPGAGEPAHIGSDLGDDDLRTERTYAGDRADEFDGGAKGREVSLDFGIDGRNRAIELIDLPEMELEQKTMMCRHAPAQSFLHLGLGALHARMCQCGEPYGISLASYDGVEHCPSALAEQIRQFGLDFDVGILQRLVNALGMAGLLPDQLLAGAQQHTQFLCLAIWD